MEHNGEGLLRIGLFSRLTAISIRMLRYYQEQQVLEPAMIDPFTGRRFYAPEQLTDAHWIVRLRDTGLPVSEIGEVMAHRGDPERLHAIMSHHGERLSVERARLEEMSAAFDRMNAFLQESTMEINVRQIRMPAMTVAALRRVLPSYNDEGQLWQELGPLMAQCSASMSEDGIGGATFHDPEYRDSDVEVEVWLQVAEPFAPVAPLECYEVPACDNVVATLRGSYEGMPEVTAALGTYLAAHELRTGPMFNIYRVGPAQNPDPASWVTDVCFPIIGE
ncbi:Multidrug-efflux transporter 1 regulator [Actinomyces bovis]|uniref:Multidrug-efflux transporter 1 regulator n=2 Tax=Actinomyces bovis TaxID=1658 RepID=A0ABY1VPD1_9ACTO|nr:Multidrug-efflux transporter 1 regulator [Actinomyces bovis]VEG53903.1 Multidrug-efflux transporter 1 regulator [Actinomyces israelii]